LTTLTDQLRPLRILHAPLNIGGNPLGLSRAERELGLRSEVLVLEEHPFGYEADINLKLQRWPQPAATAKRAFWAARSLRVYDVFHYNFGQTIYQRLDRRGALQTELPWLKRMGKRILVTFQGDDVRPPEANPFADYSHEGLALQERFQELRRDALVRFADRVFFLNPDLRRWLPGAEFRAYASVDPQTIRPSPLPERGETVVAHAPSNRKQKGTERIIAAVEALRAEGLPIRLTLIEGVSREEAVELTREADMVVDQINLGWYGGYSVEAMSLGRPVLCHIREEEEGENPWGAELPIVRTTGETLRYDLRALIADPERMRRVAAEGRSFVERHHDPRWIARENLEGLVPILGTL
jgi:glycosyltransferase involved in cell wall biosynthesis